MGKMSLTSCRTLSTPGKLSNVDRYEGGYVFLRRNAFLHICPFVLSGTYMKGYKMFFISRYFSFDYEFISGIDW